MPGSTINKLDINMPIIYCLRPKNNKDKYKIRYSIYHKTIGESNLDLFQDRTPRPYINFNNMIDINTKYSFENIFETKEKNSWIDHYAKCAINRINDSNCKYSWQDDLVLKIKNLIIEEYLTKNTIEEIKKDKLILQKNNINL